MPYLQCKDQPINAVKKWFILRMTQNIYTLFKVFHGTANLNSKTEENIKLILFNTKITDLGSIKLDIKS
jgi:hypothetical protein